MAFINIDEIIKVITTSPVKDFLISLAASASWDGMKKIGSYFKTSSTEKIIWDIFSDTMSQFYGQLHYEYDENIVVESLLSELVQEGENLTSWKFRNCLERAMYGKLKTLSDQEFILWVSIFSDKCAKHPEIFQMYQIKKEISNSLFTKRDSLIQRISAKIRIFIGGEDHSAQLCLSICGNVRVAFQQSWKEKIFSLLNKLPPTADNFSKIESLRDLAHSNEDCEVVLDYLKQIYSLYDVKKINKEINSQIREELYYPHFNKVWIITGRTGSGKTYIVNEFLKLTLATLDELENQVIPCIMDLSKMKNKDSFEYFLNEAFGDFTGIELDSLAKTNKVMKELGVKVCFIIDGISNYLSSQEEWIKIIQGIKTCSKYDQLRWIITIDEYDYFYLENDSTFLDKYCLTWMKITQQEMENVSLFRNTFSVDQYNYENEIVYLILKNKYGIDKNVLQNLSLTGISTPKEAIIFGESVPKGVMIGLPSTYFEYLKNVTIWKNDELVSICGDSVDQVLSTVIRYIAENQTDELDEKECNKESIMPLKRVQLVRPEFRRETNVFSLSQGKTRVGYRLNIYPFWAVKLTSTISKDMTNAATLLTRFPKDMQQFLAPSFIFYNYKECGEGTDELMHLFEVLDKNNLLIYVLFVAHRTFSDFSSTLYKYLYTNMYSYVDGPQTCYSVLYFVFNSTLKMREKLELLNKIEQYIPQYEFQNIYENTFINVIGSAQSEKNFKKNLSVVAKGQIPDVNHINGENAATKYLSISSVRGKEIEKIIWDIIDYIKTHYLISQIDIDIGKNESFMDFFIRRCFGEYLLKNINAIETIYQRLGRFFELEKPFGHFVKRNLTCAAGNVFSNIHNQYYNKLYIELTKELAESTVGLNRVTAFFLIENSINADKSELDPDLRDILIKLKTDEKIFSRYNGRIKKMLDGSLEDKRC